jgi:hypothetical protein
MPFRKIDNDPWWEALPGSSQHYGGVTAEKCPTELLNYLILKRNAFGVIFLEPVFGGVGICEHLEMVRIADAFACVDVDEDCHCWSLFGLRFPQCFSLRSGLNTRSTCRFNARNTPMRECIIGPRSSAAMISASTAVCQCSCRCSAFGRLVMWLAASPSVSSFLPLDMVIGCSAGHLKGSNKPGRFALHCGIVPFGPFTAFVAAQLRADLIDYHDVHLRHVSNGCGKKTDGKGEQHKSTERIDCDIYRIGHWSITLRQRTVSPELVIKTGPALMMRSA